MEPFAFTHLFALHRLICAYYRSTRGVVSAELHPSFFYAKPLHCFHCEVSCSPCAPFRCVVARLFGVLDIAMLHPSEVLLVVTLQPSRHVILLSLSSHRTFLCYYVSLCTAPPCCSISFKTRGYASIVFTLLSRHDFTQSFPVSPQHRGLLLCSCVVSALAVRCFPILFAKLFSSSLCCTPRDAAAP